MQAAVKNEQKYECDEGKDAALVLLNNCLEKKNIHIKHTLLLYY